MRAKRAIFLLMIILAILFAIITIFTGWPFIYCYNNMSLDNYLKRLKTMDFSTETIVINGSKRLGLLYGNGNHCNMEVMIFIESDLDYESIYDKIHTNIFKSPFNRESMMDVFYYKGGEIFLVKRGNLYKIDDEKTRLGLYIKSEETYIFPDELKVVKGITTSHAVREGRNYYVIVANDQENDGIHVWDFRCH